MSLLFKTLANKKPVGDLDAYIKNYISTYGEVDIYVSADSQAVGNINVWAVVIILHNKMRGGHVLYHKETADRTHYGKNAGKDYMKLYKEAELALNTANMLTEHGYVVSFIGLDFNQDDRYFSNSVLLNTMGWIQSMGYKVGGKPNPFTYVPNILSRSA